MASYLYVDPYLLCVTIDDLKSRKKQKEEEEHKIKQEEILQEQQKTMFDASRHAFFFPPSPPPTLRRTTSYGNQFLWDSNNSSSPVYDNDTRGETLPLPISRTPSPRLAKPTPSIASCQTIVKSCVRCNMAFFVIDASNDSFCSIDCRVCHQWFTLSRNRGTQDNLNGNDTVDPKINEKNNDAFQRQMKSEFQEQASKPGITSPPPTTEMKNARRNLFLQAYYEREMQSTVSHPQEVQSSAQGAPVTAPSLHVDTVDTIAHSPEDEVFYLHENIQRSKLQIRL